MRQSKKQGQSIDLLRIEMDALKQNRRDDDSEVASTPATRSTSYSTAWSPLFANVLVGGYADHQTKGVSAEQIKSLFAKMVEQLPERLKASVLEPSVFGSRTHKQVLSQLL